LPGRAVGKYLRVPPRKARDVVEQIRGLPVEEAEEIMRFSKRRAARFVGKVLKSAVASAEQSSERSGGGLYVTDAVVDEGPTLKRVIPRARGVRNIIRRRTSHITIRVEEA
jgi:large subunit ribosomal protein L22